MRAWINFKIQVALTGAIDGDRTVLNIFPGLPPTWFDLGSVYQPGHNILCRLRRFNRWKLLKALLNIIST